MPNGTLTLSDGREITMRSPKGRDYGKVLRLGPMLTGIEASGLTDEQNDEITRLLVSVTDLNFDEVGDLDFADYTNLIMALTDVINVSANPTQALLTKSRGSSKTNAPSGSTPKP